MQKLNDLSRSLTPLKPDRTLIAVIEMSLSSWLVAGIVPGIERQPLKKLEVDESTLLKLLIRWREEAKKSGHSIERIAVAFEAGRDGFWLAVWLRAHDIEAHIIHASSVAVSRERPFRNRLSGVQLLQQRLGLPQVERIKSFGEPAVDRRKKITGFAAPVLFAPEARQADRCPQFEELCALELRYRKCLMIAPLGRGWIACGIQQIAAQPMQLSLAVPLFGRLDYPRSLGEAIQSIGRLPDHSVGLGEPHKRKRRTCNSSGST